jgi:hypothetical protein
MSRITSIATCLIVCLASAGVAQAADDPSGTWKWTVEFNDMKRDMSVTLKLDGDKLTGTVPGRDGKETAIENGSYKDGEVKFEVTRERNGNKFTSKYSGKVEGKKLTGKIEMPGRDGQTRSRDWNATKE